MRYHFVKMLYLIRYADFGLPEHERDKLQGRIIKTIETQIPDAKVDKERGRIYVETDLETAEQELKSIPGIISFSKSRKCALENLNTEVARLAEESNFKDKKSFAIRIRRIGLHPFTSQEKAAELGGVILDKYPHLKVDLKNPEGEIFVEIRGLACYLFTEKTAVLPPEIEGTKFVADNMLGKLARRLRMLGFDTVYSGESSDEDLVKIARREDRLLLTRDTRLAELKVIKALLIKSLDYPAQVKQVMKDLNLKVARGKAFARCIECNNLIEKIEKGKIKDKVPEFVYETNEEFTFCPKCQKVYWKGSHYEKMVKEIESFAQD